MSKTIKISSGKQVISIESDDAGVPDVTEGTGPDIMELQDDAMAAPNEENAEFDATIDDSNVEKEDTTQAVEKANESFFNAIFGLEDGEDPTAETPAEEPEQSDTPVTPDEPAAEPEGEGGDDEGAGDVTEGDGVTTIDTGDTVITITSSDNTDSEPAEEPEAPAEEPDTPTEGCGPKAKEEAPVNDQQNTDQAIESFFENLGL